MSLSVQPQQGHGITSPRRRSNFKARRGGKVPGTRACTSHVSTLSWTGIRSWFRRAKLPCLNHGARTQLSRGRLPLASVSCSYLAPPSCSSVQDRWRGTPPNNFCPIVHVYCILAVRGLWSKRQSSFLRHRAIWFQNGYWPVACQCVFLCLLAYQGTSTVAVYLVSSATSFRYVAT